MPGERLEILGREGPKGDHNQKRWHLMLPGTKAITGGTPGRGADRRLWR